VGVAGAALAVLVFDQQAGCLDAVVGRLAFAPPAGPCEGGVAVGDPFVLRADQVRGESAEVRAEQQVEQVAALPREPGGGDAQRLQRAVC